MAKESVKEEGADDQEEGASMEMEDGNKGRVPIKRQYQITQEKVTIKEDDQKEEDRKKRKVYGNEEGKKWSGKGMAEFRGVEGVHRRYEIIAYKVYSK